MIDFNKLMDPEYQAQARAAEEAQQQKLKAERDRIDGMVNALLDQEDALPIDEARFVRSLRFQRSTFRDTSPKQLAWLERLHAQYIEPPQSDRPARSRFSFNRP